MCPEIAHVGPFTIYSYGLMLALAFVSAYIVSSKEFDRMGLKPNPADSITLVSAISGVIGAKLLSALETPHLLLHDPIGSIFNPRGLTFYGGLLLAIAADYAYVKYKKLPILKVMDAAAPAIAIAYGIGRLGCHLAGDGCYGIPTDLPWATHYTNGVVSTLASKNSELVELYKIIFPGQQVPADIAVHPTPIYEFMYSLVIFIGLMILIRKVKLPQGGAFGIFLGVLGICRFLVESIRLNPKLMFGLTEAQLISLGLSVTGIIVFFYCKGVADRLPKTTVKTKK